MGIDTTEIKSDTELQRAFQQIYSGEGGIVILDDVWREDSKILLPASRKWRALVTTRDKDLAKRFTGDISHLDAFSPDESMQLFRKILGDRFVFEWGKDYAKLADILAHRPYSIRLAAESMKDTISNFTPKKILQRLQESHLPLDQMLPLLDHCLTQLKNKSQFAYELLKCLAVCNDEGIELHFFLEWQSREGITGEQVEHELFQAQDLGLLLVEKISYDLFHEENTEKRIWLHTDLLTFLRSELLPEETTSFQKYLCQSLVISPENFDKKRSLQKHIISLCERHKTEHVHVM